jgi:UDP-2,3-diacylglucosamine hydrolase
VTQVAIFSDLHLPGSPQDSPRSDHETLFIKTLAHLRARNVDELWLLGDIFDLMVGPFPFWIDRHLDFFREIDAWTSDGRQVIWVQGNHDFFLEELLRKRGVRVSDDFIERRFGHKRVYLAHGDLVNTEDAKYLRWRAATRNPIARGVLQTIPEALRKKLIPLIGAKLSDKSRAQSRENGRQELEEVFMNYARKKWAEGYTGVCLGHSHIETLVEEKAHFYTNLGSWINYSPRYALWIPEEYNCPKRCHVSSEGIST